MLSSAEQFLAQVVDVGLMTAEELQHVKALLPAEPKDAESWANALVHAGKLTPYQASAIGVQGHQRLVFGEYVILDHIGAGGMGTVFKARHRRMDRLVAIKVLPAGSMGSAAAVERFCREARAAARLLHPNIVTAFDAGEQDGMHFLVMEYVDGRDLAAVVNARGPLGVHQAVDCVIQAAKGLEYAHARGVIHRDIKPSNLLLSSDGLVKILDMGLALLGGSCCAADATVAQITASGQIMGTIDYMSPEQAQDTRLANERSDIYSLGCTLCRLLTGDPPYPGDAVMNRLLAHQQSPIPSLRDRRAEVPEAVDRVFQQMIAKEPTDRPESMGHVIALLKTALEGKEGTPDDLLSTLIAEGGVLASPGSKQAGPGGSTVPSANDPTVRSRSGPVAARGWFWRLWLFVAALVMLVSAIGFYGWKHLHVDAVGNSEGLNSTSDLQDDFEIKVANRVRSIGGDLRITTASEFLGPEDPLPAAGFSVVEVKFFKNSSVSGDDVRLIGQLRAIESIDFRACLIHDEDLKHLATAGSLRTLSLWGTPVTDTGLAHLAGLTRLEVLTLHGTSISDEGLPLLGAMIHLRRLSLGRTRVTNAGLERLSSLPRLEFLGLDRLEITNEGLTRLRWPASLRTIHAPGTKVTLRAQEELRKYLADVTVTLN